VALLLLIVMVMVNDEEEDLLVQMRCEVGCEVGCELGCEARCEVYYKAGAWQCVSSGWRMDVSRSGAVLTRSRGQKITSVAVAGAYANVPPRHSCILLSIHCNNFLSMYWCAG
jgi:hypothetical protein